MKYSAFLLWPLLLLQAPQFISAQAVAISTDGSVPPAGTIFQVKGTGATSATNNLQLINSNNTLLMKVRDDGFVGIGTASPLYKLDIAGRIRVKTGILGNIFTTSGIFFEDYRDGSNRIFAGMQDSIRWGLYGDGSGGLGWQFNFNAKSGNIGIGSINYNSYKLKIAGNNAIDFYRTSNDNSYYGAVYSGTDTSLSLSSRYADIFTGVSRKPLLLNPLSAGLPVAFAGPIGIFTNSPTAQFHVASTMMVGDGTPAAGYTLSVNGKMICTEAKIQLKTNWPDYVFKENYRLMPLDSLEEYIKRNNHLPNMPAAADISAANGFELGEMTRLLVEKIEELTLHMIELRKENLLLKQSIQEILDR